MKKIMKEKLKMYLENIYKNPFSDYNANTMDSEQIINFWESPFGNYLKGITEEEIASERTAIFFSGGRGTGKTMLLKHYSMSAQYIRSEKEDINFKDYIIKNGYVGIYIRFDTPLLIGFDGLGMEQKKWETIFSHFFEMTLCKAFIDALAVMADKRVVTESEVKDVEKRVQDLLGCNHDKNITELSRKLADDINYVNDFKSEMIFDAIEFKPSKIYPLGSLSYNIVKIIKKSCKDLKKINFLLLLDEYENFLEYEQQIVNTVIKFSNDIAFRVGMRPMGFHTYATVSNEEFIKEHREYRNIQFDNPLIGKQNNSGYLDFLYGIAEKRLNNVSYFKNSKYNIKKILGFKEDPQKEAIEIVQGRTKHIDEYLKEIEKKYKCINKTFNITSEQLDKLKCTDNPLYEMQNMRMLLKPFDVEYVIKSFNDYKNKINSEEARKYKNDYENKYKLSYVFVLRSIYKVESKQYYGFKDFAYLSSGIVGTFIELCRCSFQYAYFSDKEALLNGCISKDIQTKAALDVAYSEFEQIQRISKVGNYVHCLAKNIGNRFKKRHMDKRISYPETNQFSFVSQQLKKDSLESQVFNAALLWSVFQKKEGMQQSSIGKFDDEVFILNRIYAPVFQISVRTRGGFNEEIKYQNLKILMEHEEIEIEKTEDDIGVNKNLIGKQLNLFDIDWGNLNE